MVDNRYIRAGLVLRGKLITSIVENMAVYADGVETPIAVLDAEVQRAKTLPLVIKIENIFADKVALLQNIASAKEGYTKRRLTEKGSKAQTDIYSIYESGVALGIVPEEVVSASSDTIASLLPFLDLVSKVADKLTLAVVSEEITEEQLDAVLLSINEVDLTAEGALTLDNALALAEQFGVELTLVTTQNKGN